MELRSFGNTGHKVSIVSLGGCGLGQLSQEEADKAVELALNHNINMIDVAPSYGEAETRLSPWIEKYRSKFFLAEKTMERTKEGAWKELNNSLKVLGTDYFDLYQFHAVSNMDELHQILGKNGAMEAFKEAKETGLIKNIGLTCHADLRVPMQALNLTDELAVLLIPVNVAALAHPHPVNDFRPILQKAKEKNIGITAIKAIAKGRWSGEQTYGTWYEPLDEQEWITRALHFTLSQEGVTTYPLPCDVVFWSLILEAAQKYHKLTQENQLELVNLAKKQGFRPLFPE